MCIIIPDRSDQVEIMAVRHIGAETFKRAKNGRPDCGDARAMGCLIVGARLTF